MKGKRIVSGLFVIAIYILFAVLLFCAINKKMNFHVDEIYSYGLANHTADGEKNMSIENGIKYIPADFPWQQYTTVSYDNRFNYKSVFENQKVDTHPPLYYCALHTICSFFPERFSKWYAGIVNIFFMLLSLMAYRKILDMYFNSIFSKNILSVIFVITPAFINETMFLRMYPMTMYIVLMTMYAFVKLIRGGTAIERI